MAGKVITIEKIRMKTITKDGETIEAPAKERTCKIQAEDITEMTQHDGYTEIQYIPAPMKLIPTGSTIEKVRTLYTGMTIDEIRALI